MKYYIYGKNRVAKDFMYIFSNIDIEGFIEDEGVVDFDDYKCISLDKYDKTINDHKIIICDWDKQEKIDKLLQHGLEYEADYLYAEDFFESLDDFTIPSDRQVAIWGTGKMALYLLEQCPDLKYDVFIDSDVEKNNFQNNIVLHPREISDWKKYFVIVAVAKDFEIVNQLKSNDMVNYDDYISYRKMLTRPSKLIGKTLFDKSYYDIECKTMLNHLEILANGDTCCCCTTFVKEHLDNIFDKDVDALWNSNLHKIMCLSLINRTYSFCKKDMCPLFINQNSKEIKCDSSIYAQMEEYPKVLAAGYDRSCNLSCITCRDHFEVAKGTEKQFVDKITEKIKDEYLDNASFVILAGNGEVFTSAAYRDIYTDSRFHPKYIRFLTNGMLFTPRKWNEFDHSTGAIYMMTVSIDAATAETYEKVRRGGRFETLKKNMEFASKLRREGSLKYLRFNFVVQSENYKEMIAFVQWGEELGVDEVFFTKVLNWGTYTEEEFRNISMMEADGVTPKPELIEVLNNPIIRDSKIVDLGTIQYAHKVDYTEKVENYYMWELEKRGGKLFSDVLI